MARGNFWEATYDPNWDGPVQEAHLAGLEASSGHVRARVVSASKGAATQVHWRRRDPNRLFQECDFTLEVAESSISNCTFTRCRFHGSTWREVKFSNCTFEKCDFSGMSLFHCNFIGDCIFKDNTASAQLFRIEETAISATAFLGGLTPNLSHLPRGVTGEYQAAHFVRTKQNLARAIYSATKDEPDVEFFHQAYEQLVRCTLAFNVVKHRWDFDKHEKRSPKEHVLKQIPDQIEQGLVLTAGWLTAWGRSLTRAWCFFIVVVAVFTLAYASRQCGLFCPGIVRELPRSLGEAINVTLVAGYTAYFSPDASIYQKLIWVVNLSAGLFWYSLIIPALTRRILR